VGLAASGSLVGVAVGGTSVDTLNPSFVGGRVEVTKTTGVLFGVSPPTLTHADAANRIRSRKVNVIFLIMHYYFFLVHHWEYRDHKECF
jgi:hypothetical protein